MKKLYLSPAVNIFVIRNEDVLTTISGNYEGFNVENQRSIVKNVYDFSVFGN